MGLWLDWMSQGARVSGNLFHDNFQQDLFIEVGHGPVLVDNNILLSPGSLLSRSQGCAYVHNLFAGTFNVNVYDSRQTPFHKAHSTEIAALHDNPGGDDRFYNNLFLGDTNLALYDTAPLPVPMDGNVFTGSAKPGKAEKNPILDPGFDTGLHLVRKPDGFYLEANLDPAWVTERTRKLVTSDLLGKAVIPNVPFEQRDGSPIRIDTDYFGDRRNEANPAPGPFEKLGNLDVKVW
jgi:hypothetical protein